MEDIARTARHSDAPLLSKRQQHLIAELRDSFMDRLDGIDGSTACSADPEYRRLTTIMLRTMTAMAMMDGSPRAQEIVGTAPDIMGITKH